MKKIIISSLFAGFFIISGNQISAQNKTSPATSPNKDNDAASAITVNQRMGSWDIHCAYPSNKQANQSQGCIAQQKLMVKGKDNSQTPIASILLEKVKHNQDTTKTTPYRLTVVTPLGFSLHNPLSLTIEHGKQITLPWATCIASGCIATDNITDNFQKSLEANQTAHLVIHRVNNTTVTINFDINELHHVFTTMNELVNKKAL